MIVFASHNIDSQIRANSSSGGIFSALASYILQNRGVVYGAGFDESWNVCHRRISDLNDIIELRGSKYVFSYFKDSLEQVLSDMANNTPVLYSGTPCQVAAIKKIVGDNPLLLCVEVICHGAPPKKYWERYLDEVCSGLNKNKNEITSISFRDKRTGWRTSSFTIIFKDGTIFSQKNSRNPYIKAFLADLTLRKACFSCPFKYPKSLSDITLGDLWGVEKLAPEFDNELGMSLIIARTDKGVNALSSAGIPICKKLDFDKVAMYNQALVRQASMPQKYHQFEIETETSSSLITQMRRFTRLKHSAHIIHLIKKMVKLIIGKR